jgi:hypothetical protein
MCEGNNMSNEKKSNRLQGIDKAHVTLEPKDPHLPADTSTASSQRATVILAETLQDNKVPNVSIHQYQEEWTEKQKLAQPLEEAAKERLATAQSSAMVWYQVTTRSCVGLL